MKKFLIIISILTVSFAYGQTTVKKSSISTSGGSYTNTNTTLLFTVGEIVIQEKTTGNIHISEGFIGPDINGVTGIEDYDELYGLHVYPNPVQTDLQIQLPANGTYEVHLFDLTGKELINRKINDMTMTLNLSRLPASVYLLVIIDRLHQQVKTLKIQKL